MKIAVIGAGITGLTTALKLSEAGHQVTIYEASPVPGGLGTYVRVDKNHMERFYHHFFGSDIHVIRLIKQLGIGAKLKFYPSKTSVFYQGKIFRFSSPADLLKFSPLPFIDRLRLGVALAQLKYLPVDIKKLDRISAKNWLIRHAGRKAYEIIWEPLLVGKFEQYASSIPAAWLRERVRDRTFKLGYLDGGTKTLFDALIKKLKKNGVTVHLNRSVSSVESKDGQVHITTNGKTQLVDRCVMTTVSPISANLLKNKLPVVKQKLLSVQDQLGAVCLLLELKNPIQDQYWINFCDLKQPVLVMVEHTNLINASHYGGRHLVYLANYIHRTHKNFFLSDDEVIKQYTALLKKLNHRFDDSWITRATISRVPRAQTIFGLNSFTNRPPIRLLDNIFMANIDQMYPHDRNFNLGVELGEKIAKMMSSYDTSHQTA